LFPLGPDTTVQMLSHNGIKRHRKFWVFLPRSHQSVMLALVGQITHQKDGGQNYKITVVKTDRNWPQLMAAKRLKGMILSAGRLTTKN